MTRKDHRDLALDVARRESEHCAEQERRRIGARERWPVEDGQERMDPLPVRGEEAILRHDVGHGDAGDAQELVLRPAERI